MGQVTEHGNWIIGDGHVHIHPCHDPALLFRSAATNFIRHARTLFPGTAAPPCFLLLTESAGQDAFSSLVNGDISLPDMTISKTREPNCLLVTMANGPVMYVVAGRQIVVREGLEVLALGLAAAPDDGSPLAAVLDMLSRKKLPSVLPWGAGKWLGKRGRIVRETLKNKRDALFFVGDNANRPYFWPRSPLIRLAGSCGIRNIQGSDPLPFSGQEKKAGSFGFYLQGSVDPDQPFQSLARLLADPGQKIGGYGRTERLFPFLRHQISMQLGKFPGK